MWGEEYILERVEPAYDDHDIHTNIVECTETWRYWYCTRPEGHDGDHEAMDAVEWVCARWGVDREIL